MNALYRLFAKEPVLLAAFVEAVVGFVVIDSDWSETRTAGLLAAVTAFNAWWVRVLSTPKVTAEANVLAASDDAHAAGYQDAKHEALVEWTEATAQPAKRAPRKAPAKPSGPSEGAHRTGGHRGVRG